MTGKVDIVPFAAKAIADEAGEYSLWWEDPRDIERVEVTFAAELRQEQLPALFYWQRTWPGIHVPANQVVGAGSQGWLPTDDWINGRWQRAAYDCQGNGNHWTYTFADLRQEEIPGFPWPGDAHHPTGLPHLGEQGERIGFRRTLKLRLAGEHMPAIAQIAVYTSSEWRETEVVIEWGGISSHEQVWDGHLEAFNGHVLRVEAERGRVEVDADGMWHAAPGVAPAGVRARIRYAYNADSNSFDQTIITMRASGETSFSVAVNDLLVNNTIYVPALGVAAGMAEAWPGLEAVRDRWEASLQRTTRQRVEDLPEQTWERVVREQPPKARLLYFVLGTEGGRQKARLHPNGDLEIGENFIRKVPGKDSQRLLWQGENLRYHFGLPGERPRRELLDGYLPILRSTWDVGSVLYWQEAFATWLEADIADSSDKQGDDTVVGLIRFGLENPGTAPQRARLAIITADASTTSEPLVAEGRLIYAEREGGRCLRLAFDAGGRGSLIAGESGLAYELTLAPGEIHTVTAKVPFITISKPDELAALEGLDYEEQRRKVAGFWRRRVSQGMQITVPNDDFNRFHRAHLTHMLIVNDREPGSDRLVPRCGGFHYGNFPDEGVMCIADLDRRGYTKEAERCLEIMAHYQGTVALPGDFESSFGVLYGSNGYESGGYNRGQGWAMFGFAEHYRYTRDENWLRRVAPVLVKACDWVTQERRRTMRLAPDGGRPIDYGFLPAGSLEDVTDYWHWLTSNVYACWGFKWIAWALREIAHPEAKRLSADAEAFCQDLMRGLNEARVRSPVVRLADGSWVPYWPARLERRGRDFGWLREVLEGSMGLLLSEMISVSDPAAEWILDDYEDNLYLSKRYGYPGTMPDFDESRWFDWGGFSMQSNLLAHPAIYLKRDEIKCFLRSFLNGFNSTFYRDVLMCSEHDLPTLADWAGDHFKTSDEANVASYMRLMLIEEHGDDLLLAKAVPREWLEHGKEIRVERALTYFGEMNFSLRSFVADGLIEGSIGLPQRNPPQRARLRLRHPQMARIAAVEMNGEAWSGFDAADEVIDLPLDRGPVLTVRAFYR